jgi:hypothetical protein
VEYRIVFYETEAGEKPVVEFLEGLRNSNPILHKLVAAGIRKLKQRDNHGAPLTTAIRGSMGMMEMRVGRTDIARVFFFFQPDREIVCTNGYVKKSQKLDPNELERAERCKVDWERRRS